MPMYSACRTAVLPAVGFPIRVSTDQWLFSAYSWLIAAVHALLRLLVPRHPPCALDILTVIFLDLAERARKEHARPYAAYTHKRRPVRSASRTGIRCLLDCCAVFKVRREATGRASAGGLSKLNSMQPRRSSWRDTSRLGRRLVTPLSQRTRAVLLE